MAAKPKKKKRQTRTKSKKKRKQQPRKGKRFTPEQRHHALVLVASGMERGEIANVVDTTTESLRRWVNKAEADGTMPSPPEATKSADVTSEREAVLRRGRWAQPLQPVRQVFFGLVLGAAWDPPTIAICHRRYQQNLRQSPLEA